VLFRCRDSPLERPTVSTIPEFATDSIVEVERLYGFEMAVNEYAAQAAADVHNVRAIVGQSNGIWVEEIADAKAARHILLSHFEETLHISPGRNHSKV
jgi:hypothetical protein